jgi:hypothetical protein
MIQNTWHRGIRRRAASPEFLKHTPKLRLRRYAHGSIRIQEGQPSPWVECLISTPSNPKTDWQKTTRGGHSSYAGARVFDCQHAGSAFAFCLNFGPAVRNCPFHRENRPASPERAGGVFRRCHGFRVMGAKFGQAGHGTSGGLVHRLAASEARARALR